MNKNQKYSDDDLNFALKEVISNQISIRKASEMYKKYLSVHFKDI